MLTNTNKTVRRKPRINDVLQAGQSAVSAIPSKGMKVSNQGYSVRANPQMNDSDQLESVRFTADFGAKVHLEWIVPTSELAKTLEMLESSAIRYMVLEQLRFGMRTELPGTYTAAQLLSLGLRKLQ
jgi:hypothetical protein